MGVCIPGHMCTGEGYHYRGCTFITGGWHPPVLHPLQGGVPSSLGVCIPGCMCTGGGIHYRGCTFIAGGVHTRTHVYWGWHPLQGVYLHNWGVASTSAASTTGGVPSSLGVYLHCWGCAYQDACVLGVYLHCNQSKISTHLN